MTNALAEEPDINQPTNSAPHQPPSEPITTETAPLRQRLPQRESSPAHPFAPGSAPQRDNDRPGAAAPNRQNRPSNVTARNITQNIVQDSDRVRHSFPIESINSMLEFRAQSESFRELEIFDPDKEKDTFVFSLRHSLARTPESEFSLSLGFSYLDESLLPPPSDAQPPRPNSLGSSSLGPELLESSRTPGPPLGSPAGSPPVGSSPPRPPRPQTSDIPPTPPPTENSPPAQRVSSSQTPHALTPAAEPAVRSEADQAGLPPLGNSPIMRTGILQFTQNYRHRDERGQWLLRSQFNLGTELASGPAQMNSDAQFFSWTGRMGRTQVIGDRNHLVLQLETQLSPSNLLPPHQFKTKDRQFSGFEREGRPSEISGNNGIRLRLENQITLVQNNRHLAESLAAKQGHSSRGSSEQNRNNSGLAIVLIPFVDLGHTWGQGNPQRPSQQFLGRAGVGLSVEPLPGLNVQLDYLAYWGDVQAGRDDQDLYVTLGYQTAW
ncbi:MAG: hypothetical protein AAFQ63_01245 [Cyanobacteria bacterium J06621_11]